MSQTATPTITSTPAITHTPTATASATLSPTGTMTPSHTPTASLTPSQTPTLTFTPTLPNTPTWTPTPGQPPQGPITINYIYDPLHRLTEANYSTGDYYHYTYDAVGNRTEQQTLLGSAPLTTSYLYDDANRLTNVNGVTYTWDDNGNLRNDGVNMYDYDSANRLISISGGQSATYAYNGLGDRLSQNGVNYTLDLNTGLTQVLNDETNQYVYGVGRISQVNTTTEYFLTDALGSVRQLTDAGGAVTYTGAYDPYGVTAQAYGASQTSYGFTGEFTDPSGMVYLRARYYLPGDGRFLTRDTWEGNENQPMAFNLWNYVKSNPINYTDPSGHSWCGTAEYNYSNRADFAEQTVERTALGYLIRDDLNTYTAVALGVQCYGSNWNLDYMNSGVGPAQVSRNQINTTYGEPVDNNRGYGLRCWIPIRTILSSSPTLREFPLCGICKTDEEMTVMDEHYKNHYQLEQPQDPNEPAWAVEYMRRRIQQVLNMCRNCSATDKFIAAALGQNGPGLDPRDMEVLSSWSQDNPFRTNRNDPIDWMAYFRKRIEENGYRGWFDTSHQINLFSNVVWELGKRGWHIPSGLDRGLISTLANRRRP